MLNTAPAKGVTLNFCSYVEDGYLGTNSYIVILHMFTWTTFKYMEVNFTLSNGLISTCGSEDETSKYV